MNEFMFLMRLRNMIHNLNETEPNYQEFLKLDTEIQMCFVGYQRHRGII